MFTVVWTTPASNTYSEVKSAAEKACKKRHEKGVSKSTKQEGLFKQIHKTIQLLLTDPKHNSLKTHEYDSIENPYDAKKKVWEAYVQNKTPGAYRVFWCYGPKKGQITILSITPYP